MTAPDLTAIRELAERMVREFYVRHIINTRKPLEEYIAAEIQGAIVSAHNAEIERLRKALEWAMDEIDALAGQACGFAYPQAMPMLGRAGQDVHYVAAVQARRAAVGQGKEGDRG